MAEGGKIVEWKKRLEESDAAWGAQVGKMDAREKLYMGDPTIQKIIDDPDEPKETPHVRNITFENIESMVQAYYPQPKVMAMHPQNQAKAGIIEHWLRQELIRQHYDQLNDQAERTVPIQGGCGWHIQWDDTLGGHNESGSLTSAFVHPKALGPQPGVTTDIEDMDWVIVKIATTKAKIKRIYGVDVEEESESEPEIRGTGGEDKSEDIITQYVGYLRNETGGIDRYSWANDTEIEDLENYQARRLPVCAKCGRTRPMLGQVISHAIELDLGDPGAADAAATEMVAEQAVAGQLADAEMGAGQDPEMQENNNLLLQGVNLLKGSHEEPETYDGKGPCPWCGGNEWIDTEQGYEEVYIPIRTQAGTEIPGQHAGIDPETGKAGLMPTLVPFYRPDIYPLVLQKNVSVYGQLLGSSDVDAIKTQQNTINRLEHKIIERLIEAGTIITLPSKGGIRISSHDHHKVYLTDMAQKQMIGTYSFSGDLHYELEYLGQVYEEARQILGITDAFQGRRDSTATSARAKEFSANMSAGRLESKRIMKNNAYSKIFEIMFKFFLAYGDEPRYVLSHDDMGEVLYEEMNRYDFLEQDKSTGEWYYDDDYIFSVDTSAPLANNQEAMWQETLSNFQSGAFGDPSLPQTKILYWSRMEMLHYPGAGSNKRALENQLQQQTAPMGGMTQPGGGNPAAGTPEMPIAGAPVPPSGAPLDPVMGGPAPMMPPMAPPMGPGMI